MSNSIEKMVFRFLEGKKLWVWLLAHLAITGVLFGTFSLVFYILGITPWIGVLVLTAVGLIWGFVQYSLHKGSGENKEELS